MKQGWREFCAHIQKDFRLEWRSKDAFNGMLFFALLVMFLFSIAFDPTGPQSRASAGGVLWLGLLFATILALNQAWARESRHAVLDALRLAPASPAVLFLSKAAFNFLFVSALEAGLAFFFVVFYNLHPLGNMSLLWAVMPLGTWALVVNGTFFAALSLRTRNREMMLPLIMFPISVPALLGAVEATSAIFTGESDPLLWIKLLAGFDVIYTTLGILLFGTVLNAD